MMTQMMKKLMVASSLVMRFILGSFLCPILYCWNRDFAEFMPRPYLGINLFVTL
jgi:hypothetical protein